MRDDGIPEDQGLCVFDWIGGLAKEALEHLVSVRDQQCADVKQDHLDHFMDALSRTSSDDPSVIVDGMRARHVEPVTVARQYVPAAARRLGECWEADEISFVDVTIRTERLHGVLRHIDTLLDPDGVTGPSVLILVPEAEQHTLGAFVIAVQLRNAGLSASVRIAPLAAELTQLLATTQFDIALVSVGCQAGMVSAAGLVKTLRLLSRGSIRILVGGSVPISDEELLHATGADLAIRDLSAFLGEYGVANRPDGVDREVKKSQRVRTKNALRGGGLDR